ncbi:hypothetical protein TNCV_3234191 [Trichonephila clavipes]|nr:hypothetical protein TNCV_3234191 [Trichonephila clavipes]
MREKGGNSLVPDLDYMVDALKLPNLGPRVSDDYDEEMRNLNSAIEAVLNRFSTIVFSDKVSLCGDDEEESNDEEYNSKYDFSTEIYPDNLNERAIIVLDQMTTSYSMA